MNKIDNFITYCNSMIVNEGLGTALRNIFSRKKNDGYEVGEPISGYDPIYSTKEKRISLVKGVMQVANKTKMQSVFKKDGIGITLFKNLNDMENADSYYKELYDDFINGHSNGFEIGMYNLWDYAVFKGENARQMEDDTVFVFIEETLNNAASQKFPGIKITSEGGDWDDGAVSVIIKRW